SSRRRHTRSYGDWSSDVCSSDLAVDPEFTESESHVPVNFQWLAVGTEQRELNVMNVLRRMQVPESLGFPLGGEREMTVRQIARRSEERRVGKGCRSRWSTQTYIK